MCFNPAQGSSMFLPIIIHRSALDVRIYFALSFPLSSIIISICISIVHLLMYILVYVLMRDEKEERKKQARSNKQTTQHTQGSVYANIQAMFRSTKPMIFHSCQSEIKFYRAYMYMYIIYSTLCILFSQAYSPEEGPNVE